MAEALLGGLGHERDAPADLEDPPRVVLEVPGQLVVVLDRDLLREEGAEVLEVLLLDHDHDVLDPGLESLLDDEQDRRLRDPVPVHHREELLLGGLARREEARAEARGGDEGPRDLGPGAESEGQARETPRSRSRISTTARWSAALLATNWADPSPCEPTPLPPADVGQRGPRGRERGAAPAPGAPRGRRGWRTDRRSACASPMSAPSRAASPASSAATAWSHEPLVDRAEQLLDPLLDRSLREGVRAVEPLQDHDGVLLRLEVHDDEVELLGRPDLLGREAVPVELHEDRAVPEGAALVHPPAARRRRDLALVGELHLAADGEAQVVDPVERAGGEHADRGARGEPLLDRQVGPEVADDEAAHAVVRQHLVGDARRVGEELPALRLLEEGPRLERDLVRPLRLPGRGRRGEDERGRVRARPRRGCPGSCRR